MPGFQDCNFDVLDYIISFLSPPSKLLSLMHSSKSMYEIGLPRLLREIVLRSLGDVHSFVALIHRTPQSAIHVRSLQLLIGWIGPEEEEDDAGIHAIAGIIPSATSLESVVITDAEYTLRVSEPLKSALAHCARLTSLELVQGSGISEGVLSTLKEIHAPLLHLAVGALSDVVPLFRALEPFANTLKSLVVHYATLLDWPGGNLVLPKLEELELSSCRISTALLERLCPNLRVLCTNWMFDGISMDELHQLNSGHTVTQWKDVSLHTSTGGTFALALTGSAIAHLEVDDLPYSIDVERFCVALGRLELKSLRLGIYLAYEWRDYLQTIGKNVPKLERLTVIIRPETSTTDYNDFVTQMSQCLTAFPLLKSISLIGDSYSDDRPHLERSVDAQMRDAEAIANALPSLMEVTLNWADVGWSSRTYRFSERQRI